MTRITGREARELLDDFNNPRTPIGDLPVRGLLETLAWLYGREPDGHDPHRGSEWNVWPKVGYTTEGDIRIVSERSGTGFTMPKLAAIELARALLTAAEEHRRADPS